MKLDHYDPITHRTREYADLNLTPSPWRRHRLALIVAGALASVGLVLAVASAEATGAPNSSSSTR
ncbi:MAG: hypothetical protein ACT4PP_09100 [Sporichthyaceae bacterium]